MKSRVVRSLKPVVEQFPGLAVAYRRWRDAKDVQSEPVETPMGFRLIGNEAMQAGSFEPEETQLVANILSRVEVFINAGANIGYYCCLAQSKGKQIVAFEPMPLNIRFLLKNLKANMRSDASAEVYPVALGDHAGIIEIYGGGTGASVVKGWANNPEKDVTLVPITTVDSVLGARFDGKRCVVVVDVEGSELGLLRGAEKLLVQEPKPIWMIEISVDEHQPRGTTRNPNLLDTFEIFWANGYEAWTATKTGRVVARQELGAIAKGGRDTLGTHNFLFCTPGLGAELIESSFE